MSRWPRGATSDAACSSRAHCDPQDARWGVCMTFPRQYHVQMMIFVVKVSFSPRIVQRLEPSARHTRSVCSERALGARHARAPRG